VSWRVRQVAFLARAGIGRVVGFGTLRLSFTPARLLWPNASREGLPMSPLSTSIADRSAGAAARTGAVLQALLAAFLGMALIAGVGFAQVEAVHNATHDTRHSIGFPCH
jgi:cobalt transporter subunit CbtB